MIGLSGCARAAAPKPVARVAAFEHHLTSPRVVDLAISVKPVPGKDPRLEIEVRAAGDELPSRWVVQKSWAGDEEVLDHMVSPHFVCDGRPEGAATQDLDTHIGWALPNRCASMAARYALRPAKPNLEWGYEFDVVVTPQLVTAIGETALLLPDVPDETHARVEVTFDLGAMPAGSEAIYSLGAGHHDTTTRALRHAYFAAGKFKTERVIAGNLTLEARFPAGFDSSTATRDLGKLLAAEADVFRDVRHEDLRLMVIGMPAGGGAHGTSLTASALLWRENANTWTSDDARLAAHEMFHLYNGQVIERSAGSGTDAQTYWFSEGFTEHYTDELMKRSGVFRPRDWFLTVRDRLRRY
ncbi:MAG: M61 family metallopeptidase, partial [Polyangiales bacterium]